MNFTQFLLILYARKWIILGVLLVAVTATAVVSFLLPKEYSATTMVIIDSKSKDPVTGQLMPSQMFPGYMATQVEILESGRVARSVVRALKLDESPAIREQFMAATQGQGDIEQWLGDLLLEKLEVEPSRESSAISITYSGADPRFAAIVANAFAKAYVDTNLELRVAPARETTAWFDQQIAQLRSKLDEAQQKLTAYQREKGLVESDQRLDVETARMAELAGQMVTAQSAAFDASARARGGSELPEVINNPVVQNLKAQTASAEGKLAELARRVGPNHPEYVRLQAEANSYRSQLNEEIARATRAVEATSGAAKQRLSGISGAFEAQKARVLELKKQREEATLLARDVDSAQRVYDAALQRYSQTRMEAESTQTDISVLNPAVPPLDPSKPRVILNIVLAVFLGGLLGIGIGFLVELWDRRIRSAQDLAELDIPLLAEIGRKIGRGRPRRRLFRRERLAAA